MNAELPDDVPDHCVVYRVVKKADVKEDGCPQSSCFSDKEGYMSVYLADEMSAAGKTADDLLAWWGKDDYTVYWFSAAYLREAGEQVWREPIEDFPGHGGVKRADDTKRTVGQKRKLARGAKRT